MPVNAINKNVIFNCRRRSTPPPGVPATLHESDGLEIEPSDDVTRSAGPDQSAAGVAVGKEAAGKARDATATRCEDDVARTDDARKTGGAHAGRAVNPQKPSKFQRFW